MFYNGAWGTLCGDNWDLKDAIVVCRQLGFEGTVAAATSSDFREGVSDRRKRWMKNVQCVGNETTLAQCDHTVIASGGSCSGSEEACAVCIPGNKNNTMKPI